MEPLRDGSPTPRTPPFRALRFVLPTRLPACRLRARTNESGIYSIPYLLPGTYRVNSEMDGFKKYVRSGNRDPRK